MRDSTHMMVVTFEGGPLDHQTREVWESRGRPFSYRHVITRNHVSDLWWSYRWEETCYRCTEMHPILDTHDGR